MIKRLRSFIGGVSLATMGAVIGTWTIPKIMNYWWLAGYEYTIWSRIKYFFILSIFAYCLIMAMCVIFVGWIYAIAGLLGKKKKNKKESNSDEENEYIEV